MEKLDVKILTLPPMHCARAWVFSDSPELAAWKRLHDWAEPRGLLQTAPGRRIFGYNNPNPAAGSPNYGYEFLLTVGAEVQVEGDITLIDLPGGLYAAAAFTGDLSNPWESIPAAWADLDAWVAASAYQHANHQWLEEHSLQGQLLALYYPVVESE